MSVEHEVAYLGMERCGSDVVTCRFDRPASYTFAPGQWFSLHLETAEGPDTRIFSHASAPSDPFLEITTRLSNSAFKQSLNALMPGAKVRIVGPGGRLSVGDAEQRIAFLVGGVGITPVRSILRDAAARGRRFEDALLVYGNRDESCVPYLSELEAMADIGVRLVLVYEQSPAGWIGESGFISVPIVRRHLDLSDGRPVVVTGPPMMVSAVEGVLDELGLPEERRRVERFGALK